MYSKSIGLAGLLISAQLSSKCESPLYMDDQKKGFTEVEWICPLDVVVAEDKGGDWMGFF